MSITILDSTTVDGTLLISSISNSATDTDRFVVSDGGVLKYRTGAQVRSDIGAGTGNGTVTSVGGTGTVSGLTLSGTVTGSGNLTLGGTLALTSANVTTALGFTPYNATNPSGYTANVGTITGVTAGAGISGGGTSGAVTVTNSDRGSSQNIFKNVAVSGQTTIVADTNNDTLTFVAGSNITLTTNATTDAITITANINPGDITGVTATAPLTGGGASGNVTVGISQSSDATDGYLSSTDWRTFNSKTSNTGTVTSVGGTGTVSGLTLSGTVTGSGNLTLGGTLALTSANVTGALGYTPYNATNPSGYTTNTGTVTSVGISHAGNAFTAGTAVTTSGTLAITMAGTATQYINGQGNLVTFPAIPQGDITAVVAGTGLSGGGTSGSVTLTNSAPNVTTNLSTTYAVDSVTVVSSDGTNAAIAAASDTAAGVMTVDDRRKLDGIANGATNVTNNNQLTNGAGYITDGNTGWNNTYGFITASSTDTLTNKSGNISQWTNDSGYTTNVGDITGVTAGTGISGGGTSGTVTITNSDRGSSQNIFKNIAVSGQTTVVADSNNDTLTFAAGSNITLTTDATTDTVTITANINPGDITGVTAGTGLSGGGTSGTVTLSIDSTVATLTGTQTFTNKSGNISQWTNNSGYTTNTGTVTSVGGTGSVSGLTLSGSVSTSGNLTLGGSLSLTAANVNAVGTISNSTTGNAATATKTITTVGGTGSADLVYANMGDNDQFRIRVGATATNAGFAEIATADDGTEPIYARQYSGVFGTLVRTAALLNESGDTSFPGRVTGSSFNGYVSTGNISQWTNDSGYTTNVGDITGVTAGTGLSGGGTSGTVTLTNTAPNVSTNLSTTTTATTLTVVSSDGTNATLPAATTTVAGVMTGADKSKLNGIAAGATNVTNNNQLTNGAGYTTNTGTTTASNTQTFTNKSGNISQWTNDSGYTTNVGDITGVTAGTGISGGGASGTVTITNSDRGSSQNIFKSIQVDSADAFTAGSNNAILNFRSGNAIRIASDPATNSIQVDNLAPDTGTPAILSNGSTPSLNSGITGAEIRSLIGAGTSSTTGTVTSVGIVAGTGMSGGGTITSSGSVTLNCTIDSPSEVGLGNLSSSGNSLSGSFTATGNITAYSDERLKTDIETIPDALEKVISLRGVTYTKDGERGLGVIAQEVEKILPEVVMDGEEFKSVAYGNIVGVLIEAIKEQQLMIDNLESKVLLLTKYLK